MRSAATSFVVLSATLVLASAGAAAALPAATAKQVVKCQLTIDKAAGKLVDARLKSLDACATGFFKCLQQDPDDLIATPSFDYGSLSVLCGEGGIDVFSGLPAIAACLRTVHECDADGIVDLELPRLLELSDLIGSLVAPCAVAHGGSGAGLADHAAARRLTDCAAAIMDRGAAFVAQRQRALAACADAVFACSHDHPGDAVCLALARGTCAFQLDVADRGIDAFRQAIKDGCSATLVDDLFSQAGSNVDSLVTDCETYGVTLNGLDTYAECVVREHVCKVDDLAYVELPNPDVISTFTQLDHPLSPFCL